MIRYHVVPARGGAWCVKRPGTRRPSRYFPTCGAAFRWARQRSGYVVTHYPDGRIRRITNEHRRRRG